jgi:hypothetical protein
LPLQALVIVSEDGRENLSVHEVIGAPLFTIVYEPTKPDPQSEVFANVAATGVGSGLPEPPEPEPPEPVLPVPPDEPEHGCPLSVH